MKTYKTMREELIDSIAGYYKDISPNEEIEEMINYLQDCSWRELKKIKFDAFCMFQHRNSSNKKRKRVVFKKKSIRQLKKELNLVEV